MRRTSLGNLPDFVPLFTSCLNPAPSLYVFMRKTRILIVEDEPGLVRVLTLMLEKLNRYEVLSVADSSLALNQVVKFKPHLVLLDWVMPKLTGGEVARQIRSDSRVARTPILVISALAKGRNGAGEVAGFPAISKPMGMDELVHGIEEQLRNAA